MISFCCCCCVCFVQSIPMHRNADGYGKSHHIKSSNIPFSLGGSFIFQTFCKCKSPFHVRGSLMASNRYNHEPLKKETTFDKRRPWRKEKRNLFSDTSSKDVFKKIKLVFAKYSIFFTGLFAIFAINCICVIVCNVRHLFERCSVMEWRRLQYNICIL